MHHDGNVFDGFWLVFVGFVGNLSVEVILCGKVAPMCTVKRDVQKRQRGKIRHVQRGPFVQIIIFS